MTQFRERNQRLTNTVGHVELLEVTNPGFTGPMHICNDVQDFTSKGVTYIALPFGFSLPDDVSGQAPRMQLVMDNVGRDISTELERLLPGTTTMARLIIVARDTPDVHEHVFWMPLTGVVITGSSASATASVDELMRQAACKQIANPFTLPGIF
ncbi:MAG: hypothetical protein DI587_38075 [Variovorax paradoxus]|nr:MAG: hypothetical protein DI583_38075 [Variovorax paradoxus]PZP99803.1 MAG: hypothetical protein DI587_38075 [Variovorax paradoxus]